MEDLIHEFKIKESNLKKGEHQPGLKNQQYEGNAQLDAQMSSQGTILPGIPQKKKNCLFASLSH